METGFRPCLRCHPEPAPGRALVDAKHLEGRGESVGPQPPIGKEQHDGTDVHLLSLERGWDRIDHAYLERWITELGLESEWKVAIERLARSTDSGEAPA